MPTTEFSMAIILQLHFYNIYFIKITTCVIILKFPIQWKPISNLLCQSVPGGVFVVLNTLVVLLESSGGFQRGGSCQAVNRLVFRTGWEATTSTACGKWQTKSASCWLAIWAGKETAERQGLNDTARRIEFTCTDWLEKIRRLVGI